MKKQKPKTNNDSPDKCDQLHFKIVMKKQKPKTNNDSLDKCYQWHFKAVMRQIKSDFAFPPDFENLSWQQFERFLVAHKRKISYALEYINYNNLSKNEKSNSFTNT